MYSLTLTRSMHVKPRDVVPSLIVGVEGAALISKLVNGVEHVQLSEGLADEKFCGYSTSHNYVPSQKVQVIQATIPAAAPYTIQLRFGSLVPTQIRVVSSVTGLLTEGNPANAGEYSANDVTGLLTFNVAQAGEIATVTVKRNLTYAEALIMAEEAGTGGQTHVNNYAPAYFNKIGVGHGESELYTDQFDVTKDFSAGGVKTGAGGLFTVGGNGDAANFEVIQLPGVGSPLLGLRFNV